MELPEEDLAILEERFGKDITVKQAHSDPKKIVVIRWDQGKPFVVATGVLRDIDFKVLKDGIQATDSKYMFIPYDFSEESVWEKLIAFARRL